MHKHKIFYSFVAVFLVLIIVFSPISPLPVKIAEADASNIIGAIVSAVVFVAIVYLPVLAPLASSLGTIGVAASAVGVGAVAAVDYRSCTFEIAWTSDCPGGNGNVTGSTGTDSSAGSGLCYGPVNSCGLAYQGTLTDNCGVNGDIYMCGYELGQSCNAPSVAPPESECQTPVTQTPVTQTPISTLSCGSADGVPTATRPSGSTLCNRGTATTPTLMCFDANDDIWDSCSSRHFRNGNDGQEWQWNCHDGVQRPALCSAPYIQPTPPATRTCPDGSVIPTTSSCPVQTQTCPDGSVIQVTQACPIPPPPPPPPTISIPTSSSAAGVPYTVSWGSSPGITSCNIELRTDGGSWTNWSGQVPAGSTSGSGSITPSNPGVQEWRNTCTGESGVIVTSPVVSHTVTPALCSDGSIKTTTRCVRSDACDTTVGTQTCGVCNAPALSDCLQVSIGSFTAEPSRAVSGNAYVLSWNSPGADSCVISGVLNGVQTENITVGASGSHTTVKLNSDTTSTATYTLTCSNPRYSDTMSLNMQVLSPTIEEF